jgi:hypothetical protein
LPHVIEYGQRIAVGTDLFQLPGPVLNIQVAQVIYGKIKNAIPDCFLKYKIGIALRFGTKAATYTE